MIEVSSLPKHGWRQSAGERALKRIKRLHIDPCCLCSDPCATSPTAKTSSPELSTGATSD
eukprot:11580542-Karenia_brevis.AAC.1